MVKSWLMSQTTGGYILKALNNAYNYTDIITQWFIHYKVVTITCSYNYTTWLYCDYNYTDMITQQD